MRLIRSRSVHWFLIVWAGAFASLGRDFSFFEPVQPPRRIQVMVHRGEARQAPENTRPAILRCVEDGLEWAEVDVRLTRDGQHVLWHDSNLAIADSTPLVVAEATLAKLQKPDVGSAFAARYAGEHVLSLTEGLALAKGRINLYLDCKSVNPEHLSREILAAGMEHQVVVYDSPDRLRQVDAAASGKLALMTKWHPGFTLPAWAESNRLAAVEIDADEITPDVTRSFHLLGIRVQAKVLGDWDRSEYWDRAMGAGVDYVQTDLPEEFLAHALWQRVKTRPVRFSLHRGANRYAPENTLPAFEKAIRLGADLVEFDVRTTSDGQFYLLHDNRLEGKTSGTGLIANTPSSIVASLSAGAKFGHSFSDIGLPTLDDFLKATAGRVGLYFDAKAIPPTALAEALARYGVVDQTVVYQSPTYLAELKLINPRIRGLAPLRTPEELDQLAAQIRPHAVDANWNILSKDLINRSHALGIQVFSDALGSHEKIEDYLQAIDWGIDLIQTDHPLRLMRALELRETKRP